ncbi:hypothetical protein [Streptomyces sp. NPDC013457]
MAARTQAWAAATQSPVRAADLPRSNKSATAGGIGAPAGGSMIGVE